MANGMLGAFMSVGAVIASASIGFLMRDPLIRLPTALGGEIPGLSWQSVFLGLSTLGFVWAILFFWWFRDRPDEHPTVGPEELRRIRGGEPDSSRPVRAPGTSHPVTPWRELVTSVPMFFICAQQFFRAAGYVFYGTWFPTYLRKTRDVSEEVSGYLTTLPLTGVVLGSLLGGLLADWIYRRTGSLGLSRKGLSIGGLACCAILMLVAYFISDPLTAASVIALGAFCAGVANPLSYALSIDLAAGHVSVVFSLMNMSGNIGAALSPKFVNWVVDATSRSPTERNWAAALLLYVAIYVAGTLCWLAIDTRRPVVTR
jgi:MFS family permease